MKMLIVDDSSTMRLIVKRTLKQAGYDDVEFQDAADGLEGLAQVESFGPNLVLSDWNMPNLNGIGFLEKLRENGNDVAFGFVTSESTADMRQRAREAGAAFLIAKPFTAENMQAALRPVLGR